MANLPDGSGDAYSNLVQGDGSASLTFVMPGTVPLAVGSVVATVDNTAGADTTATLVIRDSSGEVIATKRQAAVVDAGAKTTATWALRLDDDATPGGGGVTMLRGVYGVDNQDVTCATTTNASIAYIAGDALLDLTFPDFPSFIAAGNYLVDAILLCQSGAGVAGKTAMIRAYHVSLAGNDGNSAGNAATMNATYSVQASAFFPYIARAGDRIQFAIDHNVGTPAVTVVAFGVCVIITELV